MNSRTSMPIPAPAGHSRRHFACSELLTYPRMAGLEQTSVKSTAKVGGLGRAIWPRTYASAPHKVNRTSNGRVTMLSAASHSISMSFDDGSA